MRDYNADARALARSFLDDLRDVDASTMCEVLEAVLDADDITNVRIQIGRLADLLDRRIDDDM